MNKGKTCPQCGANLGADAPVGLCPKCLMAMNLASQTDIGDEEAESANVSDGPRTPPRPAPAPDEIAKFFPQFEIVELLGRGGMGIVYKARQKSLDRFVALKILAPEREKDSHFSERFSREAKTLAKLNHANIVTVHDFGETGGMFYLVMEYVDGVNLRQLLRTRKLSPEEALAIVPSVCEALEYAHQHGVVHRDIKPENLLLNRQSQIKIADFGIARIFSGIEPANPSRRAESQSAGVLTQQERVGTPQYMAPEQIDHPSRVDHRADIYSLGMVFYEMLTGELPGEKLEPPSKKVRIDVRLDEVVIRALEKEPERRYQTAAQFGTIVETMGREASLPASDRGVRDWQFVRLWLKRVLDRPPIAFLKRNWKWAAFFVVSISLLLGVTVLWLQRPRLIGGTISSDSSDKMFSAMGQTVYSMRIFGGDKFSYRFRVQGNGGAVFVRWEIPVPTGKIAPDHIRLALPLESIRLDREGFILWSGDNQRVSFRVNDAEVSAFNTVDHSHSFQPGYLAQKTVTLNLNDMLQNAFLDLDSGRVLSAPPELAGELKSKGQLYGGVTQIHNVLEWMRKSGADIACRLRGELTLVDGIQMNMAEKTGPQADPRAFDTTSTNQVIRAVNVAEETLREFTATMDPVIFGVHTAFVSAVKTREGRIGLIEILDGNSNENLIRLRFKLVQRGR